jgi:type VI secretion system protein ImpH
MAAALRSEVSAVSDDTGAASPTGNPGGVPWPIYLAPMLSLLRREPTSFDFFQAVRILERLRPDRQPVGLFTDPTTEVVRFGIPASISFPPAEIATLELPDDGPAKMEVNFFGLTGPQGVLPYHYTLLIAERDRVRDNAIGDFFDIFHHRIISLFYRAWQKNHVSVSYEKQSDDRLSEHLLDLIGQGAETEARGLSPLQRTLMFYVGLLGPQARGAAALEQLLEDIFGVHVEVEQFVGAWYSLPVTDQCAVGEEHGFSTQLGLGVVAGDEVWDQQTRVRIRMGPLDSEQCADFLPTGSAHALLRWLVRFFSRDAFDFEAQLVLDKDEVAGCVIGAADAEPQPLGWSTWIRTTKTFSRDPGETILRL